MSVEYAPKGLLGVLTPQANTTVEPEFAILTPLGYGVVNARLTSDEPTIEARLVDYFATMEGALRQFANAPVGAVAIACTGASYLAGIAAEERMLASARQASGVPVITSAVAVVDALNALGAKRIGLVTPYPESLNRHSEAYWTARGFTVAAVSGAFRETAAFHPIYSLPSGAAQAALDRMQGEDVDAVLMLGTGMPTLAPILRTQAIGRAPVISCMLATAWRSFLAIDGEAPSRASVLTWISGAPWGGRARLGSPEIG